MNSAYIAAALGDARREGRGWRCRCPLHGGRTLVICDGDGGRVLVTCFGGCDRLHVLANCGGAGCLAETRSASFHRRHAMTTRGAPLAPSTSGATHSAAPAP